MSDEHTPTTEEVRECYQMSLDGLDFKRVALERGQDFDRWLAALKREWQTEQAEMDAQLVDASRELARALWAQEKPRAVTCDKNIRDTVPSWAGEDQIDPCSCVLRSGHAGNCKCSHDLTEEED